MEQVEVEILGQAITAQYGVLNTGDVLRTTPAFAKHLVEDCSVAKYRTAPASSSVQSSAEDSEETASAQEPVAETAPELAQSPAPKKKSKKAA